MAISQSQKVDFLYKKLGFTKTKTGLSVDGVLSGTKKAGFGEVFASPLVIADGAVWNQSELIPTTPPGSDTSIVKVYGTTSALRMTVDPTVAGNRSFIAYTTYNDTSSARLTNWIDTQFGNDYVLKVYKDDATDPDNLLPAGGTTGDDSWFFDYSSGVLQFHDDDVHSGINTTGTNVYIVGYRYIGQTGVITPGDDTNFGDLIVNGNLRVVGLSTFAGITTVTGQTLFTKQLSVSGVSTFNGALDVNSTSNFGDDVTLQTANSKNIVLDKSDNSLTFGDSVQANFGDSKDLNIFHNGNSIIRDQGTGSLSLQSNGAEIALYNYAQSEYMGKFTNGGSVELYHDGGIRFETTGYGVSVYGGQTGIGTIGAPAILHIDPAAVGANSGTVIIKGDLQVDGTTTTVNSTTMTVADKNIEIAKGAANDTAADGAGITIDSGSGDKTWNWLNATDAWTSSEHIQVAAGKQLGFADDTNTYVDRPAADTIRFTAGGSERLRINTDGNTKITGALSVSGISTFTGNIDANGDLDVDGHTELDDVNVAGVGTFASSIYVSDSIIHQGDTNTNISFSDTDEITINTGGLERFRIHKDQYLVSVGSTANGVTNPTNTKFRIGGRRINQVGDFGTLEFMNGQYSNGATASIRANREGNSNYKAALTFHTASANPSGLSDGDYERVRISSGGYLGIGTDLPSRKVHIHNAGSAGDYIQFTNATTGTTTGDGYILGIDSSENVVHNNLEASSMMFLTTGAERLRITSGGTVNIGGDYSNTTGKLKVTGTVTVDGNIDADGNLDVDGQTDLDVLNVAELATFTGNIDANGNLDVDGYTELDDLNVSGVSTFAGAIDANGSLDVDGHTELDNVNIAGVTTTADNININANNKKLQIGSSQDLQLYSNGSLGIIYNPNNNTKVIADVVHLQAKNGKKMVIATQDAQVALYHNDGLRLQTTGYGVTVFATTETQKLNVTGISTVVGVGTFKDDVYIDKKLYVAGIEIGGPGSGIGIGTDITTRNLKVTGIATVTGNTDLNGNLDVAGNTDLNGNLDVAGTSVFNDDVTLTTASGNNIVFDKSENALKFGNDVEARFGSFQQFRIKQNATTGNSEIIHNRPQTLVLHSDKIDLKPYSNTGHVYLRTRYNSSIDLYYANSVKFATSGIGATVFGELDVTGPADIEGNLTVGVGGTTITTVVGAAASVGIGDASPSYMLDVAGAINSQTDVKVNGVSVTEQALNDAVAMAIALG